MGRTIRREDNAFLTAVLKLIPSEVVAVYLFLQGVLPNRLLPHLVVAGVLVVLTPLYLRFAMGVSSGAQLVVSTLSTVIWIYALGQGPVRFLKPPLYEPWYGSAALAIWTLVPPMLLYQRRAQPAEPGAGAPAE